MIANSVKVGAAACAIAAVGAVMPMPVAQAAPIIPAPTAVGSSLTCLFGIVSPCEPGPGSAIVANSLIYLGARNATPPVRTDILNLQVGVLLNLIPIIGPPLAGWFNQLNFEVCVGGLSARIGPYGNVTASVGQGC